MSSSVTPTRRRIRASSGVPHLGLVARCGGCPDGRARRDAVNSTTLRTIEAANGNRVRPDKTDDLCLCHRDACTLGQCHRRVFDERRVDGLVVEELDDPLLAVDVDQRLGLRTTEALLVEPKKAPY